MKYIWSMLLRGSSSSVPKPYRAEFWNEVVFITIRRIRLLLLVSLSGYGVLLYAVNVRNFFQLPENDNRIVLVMHVGLLLLNLFFLFLIRIRPLQAPSDVLSYHVTVIKFLGLGLIVSTLAFVYVILKTNGHPIFVFLAIIVWCSSLLIPPRILVVLLTSMVSGLWTIMIIFSPPTENIRFAAEAYLASFMIAIILITSGSLLFSRNVEAFRQRKIVEEERNTIIRLNAEAFALNQELERRQDILEHQATEIEIINTQLQEQNQTLRELDNEKNELMGIVAHDLKNPIGAVRSFVELIQTELVSADETPVVLGQIATTADRMLELVTNLLDVNRLEAGGIQFQIVNFDVSALIEAAVEQYRSLSAVKQIILHYRNEATSSVIVADEQATMQVLENLLSNAVKYSPHGKNVFVRILSEKNSVRVEVQDEGPGISSEDMKKLFGKFARLSARPTGGEHSTGLGLSIAKKMVEAMNGRVWCESELDKGATFIVELPTVQP